MDKEPTNTYEIISHLLSYSGQDRGNKNQVIRQCLTELLNARVNIDKIIEDIKPYRDDVILTLVEALNLSSRRTFSLQPNVLSVLEKIGNHEAVALILDNFNDYIDRFDLSLTKTLSTIAEREGERTKKLVIERYIKFLIDEDNLSTVRKYHREEKRVVAVLDSLNKMKVVDDPRLPGILEKYVKQTRENSEAHNLAQFALARADDKKAAELINKNSKATSLPATRTPRLQVRGVYSPIDNNKDHAFITLFTKELTTQSQETSYLFEFEKPLIYFLEEGTQDIRSKILAGKAEDQNGAIDMARKYLGIKIYGAHRPKTRLQKCYEILARYFNFEKWGFQQSSIQPGDYPVIIYNSEWCRVQFSFEGSGEQFDSRTHLRVYYGRLHAPANNDFLNWNGEQCWCWHDIRDALNFLDGLSPEEAIKVRYSPKLTELYRESELAKKLSAISPADWMAGMESEIWRHYGQKLFEIFDLRRPELWEQYSDFIRKIYEDKETNSFGLPPRSKVC